jgi:uncharacterized membrane protein
MGYDIGGVINSAADWLCSAPIVRSVVSNPIFTALLITALAAIVVMALYHYQVKHAGLKRGLRALLYVFLIVTAVMFVHHYAVLRSARMSAAQKGVRDVFSSIEQSRGAGISPGVSVVPMGYEQEGAVTGGDDCGCPFAGGQAALPAAGSQGFARPDNVALDADLVIEDVIVPSAASPLAS